MRTLYSWLIRGAAPLAFAIVLWRGLRDRSYWQGLPQRFGFGRVVPSSPSIWLHAVSLGEMSAAAPLIRAARERHPQIPLVLTSATPAGIARAHSLFGDAVDIRFLPYDTPGSVQRFLKRIQPRLAIIMETELWPNLFAQCARGGIPVILANARLSARSVARYRFFGQLFSSLFTGNVLIAAQSTDDARRFESVGAAAANIHEIGNVKYDVEVDAAALDRGRQLRAAYGADRPVWIAGSTHAGEEQEVLDAHAVLRAEQPDALLLLAPRHKDRFAAAADALTRRGCEFVRRSSGIAPAARVPVLLVDTLGELQTLYAAADIAFVGGSLVPVGGHNLLEPAALGLPVLTGPHHFNSKDIAELMLERGAALEVADSQALARRLRVLFEDAAERQRMGRLGQAIVDANRGSVARLLELMEARVEPRPAANLSTTR